MNYREKCDARMERTRHRVEAGLISKRFPEVSSIVVDMRHTRRGMMALPLLRTLNFSADSHAYFYVECLNKDCKDCIEGFDLDLVITSMVRSHALTKEGELDCKGEGLTSGHVHIAYKVTIQYNEN
jgi:hypothetical protein